MRLWLYIFKSIWNQDQSDCNVIWLLLWYLICLLFLFFSFLKLISGQACSCERKVWARNPCVWNVTSVFLPKCRVQCRYEELYLLCLSPKHTVCKLPINITVLRYLIELLVVIVCLAEESEDFYEFTAEDYYRILGKKKEGNFNHDHFI